MAVPLLKPRALRAGAKIAVIAPASSAKAERLDAGIAALRRLGYDVVEGKHLRGRSPQYFSGEVEERLEDFHRAFADPEIGAIICSRGGYGSNYLLERLDLELIRRNPKPLFGYSDLTVAQTWLLDQAGLVAFHGPMVAADFDREDGVDSASFAASVEGGMASLGEAEGLRTLRPGRVSGTLCGGCLSMIVSTLGTAFAAQTEGKLLFLEDVNAKPYQIDRMLRQLILAGKLDGVKGIVFGEMLDCAAPTDSGRVPGLKSETTSETRNETWGTQLEAVILRVLDRFEGPIGIGLRSGHVSRGNVTLPLGLEAELDLRERVGSTLRLLEPAVRI
jgi:muramoyltetrapeptide carboxypeptidase